MKRSILFGLAALTSCAHLSRKQNEAAIFQPAVGVVQKVRKNNGHPQAIVFIPAKYLEVPPLKDWVRTNGSSGTATVAFNKKLKFFRQNGEIWTSPLIATAQQKVWCENDGGIHVGTFVTVPIDEALRLRLKSKSLYHDVLAFAATEEAAGPVVSPTLYSQVRFRPEVSDAGCGEGQAEGGLVLIAPGGEASLRCCGP